MIQSYNASLANLCTPLPRFYVTDSTVVGYREGGKKAQMNELCNFTTFDIIVTCE